VNRLKAVTFDFWSTLVDGNLTPERTAARLARLHAAIVGAGHAVSSEELKAAFDFSLERVTSAARESLEDVGPPGRWAELARELGIPEGLIAYEVVEKAYEDITLEPLPDAMPHARAAVEAMRQRGFRLGVICNTGMAGGRVLREVLRRHGLLDLFDVTVFSNEFGMSKPHPSIFVYTLERLGGVAPSEALHVGDIEELDVEGARRAGLWSALYAPDAPRDASMGSRDASMGSRDASMGSRDGSAGSRDASAGSRDASTGSRDASGRLRDVSSGSRDAPRASRDAPTGSRDAPATSRDASRRPRDGSTDGVRTDADLVVRDWRDFAHQIDRFVMPGQDH
jgi:putative hydrolase of the HAD superfamily